MSALSVVQKIFPTPGLMSFPCVGVDVSDTSLKYIQFERPHHRGDVRIKCYGDVDIPVGTVERGNVHDVGRLASVLAEMKVRTGAEYIRMSLPEERAYLFETTIDAKTKPQDIRGLIDFRLEENVPLPPKDVYFNYAVVSEDVESHTLRVVVAVYALATIESYYAACAQAGLVPLSFEIEAQSIARATTPRTHEGAYMIVDFGKTRMGIGIVYNGALMYTSTIEVAGVQMSADMRDILGDVAESELTRIKNEHGLSRTKENKDIAAVLQKYADVIAEELNVRMRYWETRSIEKDERAIKKVIVCGGSANLFGLPEFLTNVLDTPTERASVWMNAFSLNRYIPEIDRRHSYGYATAVGLALKDFV